MAKDWIKMRVDLPSHPKVVRILSATKSDKFRVVGGLHAVWSVFDTHSTDGRLEGYTPETMDHIIGWEGFSEALINVGWLEYDGDETLAMPDFDVHNGQSAKRRAEETERKRKTRNSADNLRTECGQSEDKVRSRGEERRREKETPPKSPKGDSIDYSSWPAFPEKQTWDDWIAMRKKLKTTHSQTAMNRIGNELQKAVRMGYTVDDCLSECVTRGWKGFKAEWLQSQNNKQGAPSGPQRKQPKDFPT